MSDKSSIDDGLDLMLQDSFSLPGLGKPPRELWRRILLMLRACKFLIYIADEAKKASLALSCVSSSRGSYHHIDGNSYITDAEEPPAPQLSIDIHSDGNVKLQHDFIANIVKAKDLTSLHEFGGVQGVAEALDTNLEKGLSGNVEDHDSQSVANTHSGTHSPAPGFIHLLLKACNNYTIFLLLLSAVLSLGFGIKEEGLSTGWVEGVIIFIAVIILVFIPSVSDFWYGSSQRFLEKKEMMIDVLREGCQRKISKSHVSLGDLVCLKRGDQVPADGLFISGELLISDDGLLSKVDDQNPFMFDGAKVIKGSGHMLVTSVGVKTVLGEMMSSITHDKKTPLHARLERVNTCTEIFGLLTSLLIIIILFLRFELEKEHDNGEIPEIKAPTSMKDIIDVTKRIVKKPSGKLSSLMTSLIMLLVGIVEGLPFQVTLSITYWNRKILHGRAFAQELLASVTIGSVTTICTDKSGGLTLNPQEVDSCWIGEEVIDADSVIASHVLEALCDGIGTPVQLMDSPWTSQEDPLRTWIEFRFGMNTEFLKQSYTILDSKELDSREGGRGVLIRKGDDGTMYLHWKGPATTILRMCSFYYDIEGKLNAMDRQKMMNFAKIVEHMQSKHVTTLAFAYKQIEVPELEEEDLTLLGLVVLKPTCWEATRKAMEDFRNAGVCVKLISGDNLLELESIARKCGVLMPNSDALVIKGETFRNSSQEERMLMADKISVMGNSLPSDRLLLVKCLKEKVQIVAVVGAQTNDSPALKEADVGLTIGSWSSKMARESSDIIIPDGTFSSLVTILKCGRCTYENIRKYIQFGLTLIIAGFLIITITTSLFGDTPITSIQSVWATLVLDVLGALALLTEPPTEKLMEKQPIGQTKWLITKAMWRNIVIQVLYQVSILVTFQFIIREKGVSKTLIFNTFVVCQIFNQINARELEEKNVFKGIHKNKWFWVAMSLNVVLQVAYTEIAHILASNDRLNYKEWGISILIGMGSLAIDFVAKLVSGFINYWTTRLKDTQMRFTRCSPSTVSGNQLPLINAEIMPTSH